MSCSVCHRTSKSVREREREIDSMEMRDCYLHFYNRSQTRQRNTGLPIVEKRVTIGTTRENPLFFEGHIIKERNDAFSLCRIEKTIIHTNDMQIALR